MPPDLVVQLVLVGDVVRDHRPNVIVAEAEVSGGRSNILPLTLPGSYHVDDLQARSQYGAPTWGVLISAIAGCSSMRGCQKGLSLTIVDRRPRQFRKKSSARRSAFAAEPNTRTEIGWPTPSGT